MPMKGAKAGARSFPCDAIMSAAAPVEFVVWRMEVWELYVEGRWRWMSFGRQLLAPYSAATT